MSTLLLANREYRQMIAASLAEIRESGLLMDVTIVCGNQQFKAHKIILIASSGYFYSIFTKKMKTDIRQLAITDISPEILRMILDYIYTGTLNTHCLVRVKMEALQRALHYLDMTDVYRHRLNLMMKSLAPSYYAELWSMANKYQIKDMSREISKFVASHLESCMDNAYFVVLTLQQLISILSNEQVKQMPENVILQAIQQWVLHDVSARDRYVTSLLSVAKISAASRAKAAQFFDGEFQNAQLSPNRKRITSPRSVKDSGNKLKSATLISRSTNYLRGSNASEGNEKVIRVWKKKSASESGDDSNRPVGNVRKVSVAKKNVQSRAVKESDGDKESGTYTCSTSGDVVGDNRECSSKSEVVVCNLTEASDGTNSSAFVTCKSRSPVSPFSCFNSDFVPVAEILRNQKSEDEMFIDCEKYPTVDRKKVGLLSAQREKNNRKIKEHSYEEEKLQMVNLKNKLNEIIQSIRGTTSGSPDSSGTKSPPTKNYANVSEISTEKTNETNSKIDDRKYNIKNSLAFGKKSSGTIDEMNDYTGGPLTSSTCTIDSKHQDRCTFASGDFQDTGTDSRPFSVLSLPNSQQQREVHDISPRSGSLRLLKSKKQTEDASTVIRPINGSLQNRSKEKLSFELKNFEASEKENLKRNQKDAVYTSTAILHRPIATNSGSLISPEEVKSRLEKFKKIMYARNQNRVDIETINLKGSKSFIICNSTDSSDKSDGISDTSENVIDSGLTETYAESGPEWMRTLSTIPEEASVSDFVVNSPTDIETASLFKMDADVRINTDTMVLIEHKQIKKPIDVEEEGGEEKLPTEKPKECPREILADWSKTLSQVMEQQKQLQDETIDKRDLETKAFDVRKKWNIPHQESDGFRKDTDEDVEFWLQSWPKKFADKGDVNETSPENVVLEMVSGENETMNNLNESPKDWNKEMYRSPRPADNAECVPDVYPSPSLSYYHDSSSPLSMDDFRPDSLEYPSVKKQDDFISKTLEMVLSRQKEETVVETQSQLIDTGKSENSFEFGGYQCFTDSVITDDDSVNQLPADALNITLQNLVRDSMDEDTTPKCGDDWKTWKSKLSKTDNASDDVRTDEKQITATTTKKSQKSFPEETKRQLSKTHHVEKPTKTHESNLTARTRIIDNDENSDDSDTDANTIQTRDSVFSFDTSTVLNLDRDYPLTTEMGPIIVLLSTTKNGTAAQQLYSVQQRCWLLPRRLLMPPTEYSYSVCYLNECIYYIGGLADGSFKKMHEVYVYRLGDHVLVQAADLLVARVNAGVAHMHGLLYVAGGIGRYHKPISQVERYNTTENRWQLVSALHVARSNISLVACGKLLFAIGGTVLSDSIGESVSKVCESYDTVIDQWSMLVGLPSHFDDYNPLVASVDCKLYAVRMWKPELVFRFHTNRNKWLAIQNTKIGINKVCCLLPGEKKLYAIELAGRTIHTFDMHAFQWEVETHFPKDVFWQAAAFVINQTQ